MPASPQITIVPPCPAAAARIRRPIAASSAVREKNSDGREGWGAPAVIIDLPRDGPEQ
ncbi:hypothetical protein GCM10027176_08790 [Actinoallomurus bryophytorum]